MTAIGLTMFIIAFLAMPDSEFSNEKQYLIASLLGAVGMLLMAAGVITWLWRSLP